MLADLPMGRSMSSRKIQRQGPYHAPVSRYGSCTSITADGRRSREQLQVVCVDASIASSAIPLGTNDGLYWYENSTTLWTQSYDSYREFIEAHCVLMGHKPIGE